MDLLAHHNMSEYGRRGTLKVDKNDMQSQRNHNAGAMLIKHCGAVPALRRHCANACRPLGEALLIVTVSVDKDT